MDPKTSRKIFELAKDQQDELDEVEDEEEEEDTRASFTKPRDRILQDEDDDDWSEYDEDAEEEVEEIVRTSLLDPSRLPVQQLFRKSTRAI